jgi:hypothetical protein
MTPAETHRSATGTVISQKTSETSAFDRTGSSRLRANHQDGRLTINTLAVLALLAFVAYWWFGLR